MTPDALRDVIRRLAEREDADFPILSVYLDVRGETASGGNPTQPASLTVLRDRLRQIEETYTPHDPDHESVAADIERIQAFVDQERDPATQGLAIFASTALGLWEVVEAGVPFTDSVSAGPIADLFQLARLLDEHETAVVALLEADGGRLFVTRTGGLEEVDASIDRGQGPRRRRPGGWSQSRYQRRADKEITDFLKDMTAAIEELVTAEETRRLVIVGDEILVPQLAEGLSATTMQRVEEVAQVPSRTSPDEVDEVVRPILERFEAEEGGTIADQILGLVRGGGLAVTGTRETRRMLEAGAVDTLAVVGLPGEPPERTAGQDVRALQDREEVAAEDAAPGVDLDDRNELVRLAALTSATVQVVEAHPGWSGRAASVLCFGIALADVSPGGR
jgi:peptide subunit release factor 1 (eRF1)